MAISDKTRKILWTKSGNECAICKKTIVVEPSKNDGHSIIADECHIIAQSPGGPRYDSDFPQDQIDEYFNLILLCKSDHKLVDDQVTTYTAEVLRLVKSQHEKRISERGSKSTNQEAGKARFLRRIQSGKELFSLIDGMHGFEYDFDETSDEKTRDAIYSFLQNVQDYGDISDDFIMVSQKLEAMETLKKMIQDVESVGYFVFGDRETRIFPGEDGKKFHWTVGIVHLINADNPTIIKVSGST